LDLANNIISTQGGTAIHLVSRLLGRPHAEFLHLHHIRMEEKNQTAAAATIWLSELRCLSKNSTHSSYSIFGYPH